MTERIIDISDGPARVSVKHSQLQIEKDGEIMGIAPLSEVAALLVSHPAVTYTNAVLSGLCQYGGLFVLCGEKHLPAGMLMPFEGHFVQTERFSAQVRASLPLKKQLWRQIVRAKVRAQGNLLQEECGRNNGLLMLAERVGSGDCTNIEAQAARRYWGALFGKEFTRDRDAPGPNIFLNYGYTVLRAAAARAICAAGLHPSLGLHHHNRYNGFCLADDLMEPYRPAVDDIVLALGQKSGGDCILGKESKAFIIKSLMDKRFVIDGESRGLFDSLARSASSLASVFSGKRKTLLLPV
ncbi:MAG: type II CRISPR-associated endonuclease Cas1 [Nitrospiraceae bacterium]|nr:type II CRISPR-associated endonuclease Cas1 [Nitrospiraceae bacterium]